VGRFERGKEEKETEEDLSGGESPFFTPHRTGEGEDETNTYD